MKEPPALTLAKHLLTKAVEEWMVTGILLERPERHLEWQEYWKQKRLHAERGLHSVKIKRPEEVPPATGNAVVRALVRQCAKDTGRPYITAEATFDHFADDEAPKLKYWEINFPNDASLAPVVAHLMLGAKPITSSQTKDLPPIGHVQPAKSRNVFRVEQRMFDIFLARCKNDPLFHKALGNTPEA